MHLGHVLRVATRGLDDPESWLRARLAGQNAELRAIRTVRASVEDAFVSTVRSESQDPPEPR
jgi:hypothetical protein